MAWTDKSGDDRLRTEENRIEQHTTGSAARAIVKEGPKKVFDPNWHISLSGLPTEKGSPVTLAIGGKQVFKSQDDGGDVNTTLSVDSAGYGTVNSFHLEIPVMNDFKADRSFNLKDGNYVRFAFTNSGLSISQQTDAL